MEIGFYLKKFISYFIEPFGMVLGLFVLGFFFLFFKREKLSKLFLTFGLFMMLLYSYPPFANFLITQLENQYPKYDYKEKVKYIHVLGNGHNTDKDQPLSSQISPTGIKRDLEGILIHLNMKDSKIIFTGYEGNTDISNAQMNANLALALGISRDNLIINGKPKDTKEEAEFTKSIIGKEKFILVTSATHMPRAILLYRSLGMDPIPASTNFYKEEFLGYLRKPSVGSFYKSQIAMHEYVGIIWSKLKANI